MRTSSGACPRPFNRPSMASEQKTELVKKYKLTEKELGRECSKDHSLDIGEFISWKDVGPRLAEVDNEDVVAIDKDGRDEADKRRLLINMWKKRNGSNATYDAMITAMLKARTRSEAERVCKMLSPANPGGPLGPRGKTLDDSPGLAILVTCDYEGTEQSESTLPCTREDAVEMKKTFDYFNYVVHQLLNPAKADITALLTEVTDSLMTYNAEKAEGGKVIIFAFSGQGSSESEGDVIYANNGEPLNLIDEIVLPLVRHKAVFHVPKLFFIDACRGHMKLDEVISVGAFKCVGGNYRIDYSTLPRHFSYISSCGSSLWMPRLAQALREQNDSLQDIARKVKNDVYLKQGKKQLPDSDDYLRGPLYLQKQ